MIRGAYVRLVRFAPLAIVVATAAATAAFSHRSPTQFVPELSYAPPSSARPFGSGEAGVDLLALVAQAEIRAVLLAVTVAAFGCAVGMPLGAMAALAGGRAEALVGRSCDLMQALPTFLLAIVVLSSADHPTRVHLGFVFGLSAWAPFARLALAEGRVLRTAAFVEAARALGRTRVGVILVHVVPNLLGVMAVQLGSTAAAIVVSEAALAFVGLGPRDGVSLGSVLDQGVASMIRAPHVLIVGSVAVFATSTALLFAGRALEPAARAVAPRWKSGRREVAERSSRGRKKPGNGRDLAL